jgi:hypothetical protein
MLSVCHSFDVTLFPSCCLLWRNNTRSKEKTISQVYLQPNKKGGSPKGKRCHAKNMMNTKAEDYSVLVILLQQNEKRRGPGKKCHARSFKSSLFQCSFFFSVCTQTLKCTSPPIMNGKPYLQSRKRVTVYWERGEEGERGDGRSDQPLSFSRRKVKGEGCSARHKKGSGIKVCGYPAISNSQFTRPVCPAGLLPKKGLDCKHMLLCVCRYRFVGYSTNIFAWAMTRKNSCHHGQI